MKLAEALQERADLNRKIEQLKQRIITNAVVQEGESPAEDPNALLKELNRSIARLEELIASINLANCRTVVDGRTLTEMIAEKDCLTVKISAYRNLVSEASRLAQRAYRTEIKVLSTVNVKDIQAEIDRMSKELRLLDNTIQQTNWNTEL